MIDNVTDAFRAELKSKTNRYSPARAEGFMEGADHVLLKLANEGFDAAVGTTIDVLLKQVRGSVQLAQEERERLDRKVNSLRGLQFAPELLDERAQGIAALVSTLLDSFVASACPVESRARGFSQTVPSDPVYRKIVEAVSYITWAYLTNGAPLPAATIDREGDQGHE
jgi:hypothetical protein